MSEVNWILRYGQKSLALWRGNTGVDEDENLVQTAVHASYRVMAVIVHGLDNSRKMFWGTDSQARFAGVDG